MIQEFRSQGFNLDRIQFQFTDAQNSQNQMEIDFLQYQMDDNDDDD